MILVYCDHITSRHRFIFSYIFEDMLGMSLHLTMDQNEFVSFAGPKINYRKSDVTGAIRFRPHPLLSETGISPQVKLVEQLNNVTVQQFNSLTIEQLSIDPFALSFYLVTRYEEYLPFHPDQHDRFPVDQSIAFEMNFLRLPLVNVIAEMLKKHISDQYPGTAIPGQPFHFLPTVDIDIAFAHLGKGLWRASGAWAKILLTAQWKLAWERLLTLSGKKDDPYNNFGLHLKLAKKYNLSLIYFVLLGDLSQFDRNTSYEKSIFRKLIKYLSNSAMTGLHPSYRSHLNPDLFEKEQRRLEKITEGEVTYNRFHFLRLKFPDSYRLLIAKGITDDFSLGYSTVNGFRASTCTPFYFYDLERDEITNLRVHPFIFMDSVIIDQLEMKPAEAIIEIRELVDQVKKYGGEAIGIWHNYSLSEKDQYKGWQEVLATIFEHYQKADL